MYTHGSLVIETRLLPTVAGSGWKMIAVFSTQCSRRHVNNNRNDRNLFANAVLCYFLFFMNGVRWNHQSQSTKKVH